MIIIKLFGLLKSLAHNQAEVQVPLNSARTVADLVALLDKDYPAMAELIHKKKVLVSVNLEVAHQETVIHEGDEVALLPPCAGGGPADPDAIFARIQREDFSLDAEVALVRARSRRIGGIAVFL